MQRTDPASRWVGGAWLALCVVALALVAPRPGEREIANYVSSLEGRTPNQAHNARLAARAINGATIPPGGRFSFNGTVGPWTRDRGYRRAPVSFGGEMVIAYGGGVCQVSSTLYNAALLGGLTVAERDHHVWEPGYVPAGRDAAVAQGIADLVLVNPHPAPVRLRASAEDGRLAIRVLSRHCSPLRWTLEVDSLSTDPGPPTLRFERDLPRDTSVRVRAGHPGRHVRVERLAWRAGQLVGREAISDDTYLPLGAVTQVGVAAEAR